MTTIQDTYGSPGDERTDAAAEFGALQTIIAALQALPVEARGRIVQAAATFLKLGYAHTSAQPPGPAPTAQQPGPTYRPFSDSAPMAPKDFLLEKQPRTDVERVACLAFYLTHYRDTPHFKTLDLSKLNTEAAQPKFSNAANSTNNAVKRGYLVPASKGQRQLSAAGEQFVRALPDRDAARSAMANLRPRRRSRRLTSQKKNSEQE